MSGQRGRLGALAGIFHVYEMFRRAEVFVLVEVYLPRRPHTVLPRPQVLSEKRNGGARGILNLRQRLAFMRTSRKTDFR